MSAKLELYGCGSPNVVKVQLLLKELKIPFTYHEVDWRNGQQYKAEFVKINPNSKLPVIVDHDVEGEPINVFESGNILLYLANKYAKGRLVPDADKDIRAYTEVMNWLFWQMANIGPIFGNWYHFTNYATDKYPYSIQRFGNELRRLFHVLDNTLKTRKFVAGDTYSISDIAIYPWARIIGFVPDLTAQEFPNVYQYIARIKAIPSVVEWETFEEEERKKKPMAPPTEEQRKFMFGVDGRAQN
ncbi:putative glutathione transferase [Heterostelium album PN500]|uniref:Putative glutathione transferase n=1 Tax=Heterostelium pallidum (strain ATCC 26659 / Pp 5 / PN500) TaxID=670386 RepID=D3B0Z2_HETP5|nr:putative glutathione transferase [Heterostelium album PN500]EFA84966.1 putative glutathione transferase [Heterostelium album PN500]|eukprot:XP_020437076.1 putative glutathione transferase [Heterostelium album PN500]